MKYYIALALALMSHGLAAQIQIKNLYRTWVISRVTYIDDRSLPDEHPYKNIYLKYTFSKPTTIYQSPAFSERGNEGSFEINNNYLQIKSPEGGFMNAYHIEALKDTLVLTQAGQLGYSDPNSLKFYFIPETQFQNGITLTPDDIFSVNEQDTIYNESRKIYASYKGKSFQQDIYNGIKEKISMDGRTGHLAATFVISATGTADSAKILEGIDNEFNARFKKVFVQFKRHWTPASLNGRPVSVRMMIELRYFTSDAAIPSYINTQDADQAFRNKDYETAIFYYDKALTSIPTDKEILYKRGMCKMLLGNKSGACEDWNNAKTLGSTPPVDAMLEKYCR